MKTVVFVFSQIYHFDSVRENSMWKLFGQEFDPTYIIMVSVHGALCSRVWSRVCECSQLIVEKEGESVSNREGTPGAIIGGCNDLTVVIVSPRVRFFEFFNTATVTNIEY